MRLSDEDQRFIESIISTQKDSSDSDWKGGDGWIRQQFESYFLHLCAVGAAFNQADLHSSSDEQMEAVEDFNMAWFHAWQQTESFIEWRQNLPPNFLPSIPIK